MEAGEESMEHQKLPLGSFPLALRPFMAVPAAVGERIVVGTTENGEREEIAQSKMKQTTKARPRRRRAVKRRVSRGITGRLKLKRMQPRRRRVKKVLWSEGFQANERERLRSLAKEFSHLNKFQLRKIDDEREREKKIIRAFRVRRELQLQEKQREREERADRLLKEIEDKKARRELRRGMRRLAIGDKMQMGGMGEQMDIASSGEESEESEGSCDDDMEVEEAGEEDEDKEGGEFDLYGCEKGGDAAFDEDDDAELGCETWDRRVKEPCYEEEEEECA